ncbi:MAG TPA: peptidylprolyl isomerase [Candidatus Eisenbacteria bacterium]|jgi:peptidyl-prolyl cis-trans isomerase C|nr:peptidylprolyl isomerase [Candidatus Eisenbacteria bacterium]
MPNPFIRKALTPLLFLLLATALTGCGEKKNILARFSGMSITEEEFKEKIESLPRQLRGVVLQNKKEFIEDLAAEHFLLKEAQRRGVDRDPEVKELLEQAKKKIIAAKLVETEVDNKISLGPEEASRYYEAHKDEFMAPALYRASHILVKTEDEAKAVKLDLETGADFEETARKKSVDSTAFRGGDLGFFQKGQLVPEFERAAFAMKKGEISGIVKSRFGYHIIKLTDQMEPTLRPFKAVKRSIEEKLLNEKRSEAFKALVKRLRGNAEIKVDDKALARVTAWAEKKK